MVCVGLLAVARSSPGWPGRDAPALGSLPPAPARRPQSLVAVAVAGISLAVLIPWLTAAKDSYRRASERLPTSSAASLWIESQVFGSAPRAKRATTPDVEQGVETGAPPDRGLERALAVEELLIPWDLERARIERRLLDLTLTAGEERALREELATVAAGRRQAESRARQDLASGAVDAAEVIAGSPVLRGLLAQRRYQARAAHEERGKR